MHRNTVGLGAIIVVALASITVPVGVDGLVYASAHMQNPRWLPHARLHCAMSFHDSMALGAGALGLLWLHRDRLGRGDVGLAALLAAAPWAALLAAGLWPGTSYTFAGDPAFADMTTPYLLGVPLNANAVLSVVLIVTAAAGYAAAVRPAPVREPVSV